MARNAKGQVDGSEGNTFSSTNQPENRGRKPKIFSQIAKEFKARGIEPATPEAVKEAYEYILALTLLEVLEIAGTPKDEANDYPMLVRLVAQEVTGKRKMEMLSDMLDRAHGKARQSTDMNVSGSLNVVWHEELTHADEVNEKADNSD